MKLIYISHWRFPSEKTMSPLIMRTCEQFVRRGFAVELWIPKRKNKQFQGNDPFEYHQIAQKFEIRWLPVIDLMESMPGPISFSLLLGSFVVSLFFAALRRTKRGDIFYFHDIRDAVSVLLLPRPTFVEIHDFYKSSLGLLNRWCFRRISGFIVTNHYKMELLAKDFHVSESRMLHQPNAVNVEQFSITTSQTEARIQLDLPRGSPIVLYTGHLFGWKGVDTLLASAEFLPEGALVYFVGGTDEDIKEFRVKSLELKVQNVIIAGRKPHQEIPLWLRAADVLILPNTAKEDASKYETSPVKLFEYMASGRPVVASDLPSIRNVVDERLVFFFEPDNPESLAHACKYVLEHIGEARERTDAAQEEVKKYTWEKRGEAIAKFINTLVK